MNNPSEYEIAAWNAIQHFKENWLSQVTKDTAEMASRNVAKFLEANPKVEQAYSNTVNLVKRGKKAIDENMPDGAARTASHVLGSVQQTLAKVFRFGLSSKRVVQLHKKRGHEVEHLHDLRTLDLKQIDAVGRRGSDFAYPTVAALSGAASGLIITGGELVVTVTGGAAAAPTFPVLAAAFAGDAALVYGVSSRAIGNIALRYGYNPEDPAEKIYVMSVINFGSAMSAGAKTVALRDLSALTQAIVRGKTWAELQKSVLAKVAKKFSEEFAVRLTKQNLGKLIPAAGIVIGGALNWSTVDNILDAAEIAYRRRFLVEKYPEIESLYGELPRPDISAEMYDDRVDQPISLLETIESEGGEPTKDQKGS